MVKEGNVWGLIEGNYRVTGKKHIYIYIYIYIYMCMYRGRGSMGVGQIRVWVHTHYTSMCQERVFLKVGGKYISVKQPKHCR